MSDQYFTPSANIISLILPTTQVLGWLPVWLGQLEARDILICLTCKNEDFSHL